jgi:proteasome alpha subunit
MITPYDWQEGIGNRAQYIEGKLEQGVTVVAVSVTEGILFYTRRRKAQKIYEIYDRVAFAAVGQQSDIEAVRMAALEFASREGFSRSEDDVTLPRIVTAVSNPIKRAFSDFGSAPVVARGILAEVNATPDDDQYYLLDFDGDYELRSRSVVALGPIEAEASLLAAVEGVTTLAEALEKLGPAFTALFPEDDPRHSLTPEAVLLRRDNLRDNRFQPVN